MIPNGVGGRRPLTRHQRRGLQRRTEVDADDVVKQVFEGGGGYSVTAYPDSAAVVPHIPHEEGMTYDLARMTALALLEAADFAVYGPGRWIGDGEDFRWEPALDKNGNDRAVAG